MGLEECDGRSWEVIKSHFANSAGFATIGLRNFIIGPGDDADFAAQKFRDLIGELVKIEGDTPKGCAWVMELSDICQKSDKTKDEITLLKRCLEGLDEDEKSWLRKRSAFVVAGPEKKEKTTKADCFYRGIARNSKWLLAEAATAFQMAEDERELTFEGHQSPRDNDWEKGPEAFALSSPSTQAKRKRCSLLRRAIRVAQYMASKSHCDASASKLRKDGFKILEFEDFLKFSPS